jgi:hypothetical protein
METKTTEVMQITESEILQVFQLWVKNYEENKEEWDAAHTGHDPAEQTETFINYLNQIKNG